MAGSPDPKPQARYKATAEEWALLRELTLKACDYRCVACGEDWMPALSCAHIIGRDEGGDDVRENLVILCGYKAARPNGCHVRLQEHRNGWEQVAHHVRAYVLDRASRYAYVISKVGRGGFEKRYPTPVFLALGDLERYRRPDPALRETE